MNTPMSPEASRRFYDLIEAQTGWQSYLSYCEGRLFMLQRAEKRLTDIIGEPPSESVRDRWKRSIEHAQYCLDDELKRLGKYESYYAEEARFAGLTDEEALKELAQELDCFNEATPSV